MPVAADRAARLFYDDACGPCALLARTAEGVSRHRVQATPLTSPEAETRLAELSPTDRFSSAHLEDGAGLRSGADLATPLVGLALGPRWAELLRRLPPADRALRAAYRRLWEYRRTRGCARVSVAGARTGP